MITDVDMDTTTAMSTSTLMLVILIHIMIIPTTQSSMCLAHPTMTMPAIMCTGIQIRKPSIPLITVNTIVLIIAIPMLLWHIHNRIRIHNPITLTNDKRTNLRIPIRMCTSILTSHILISIHRLLRWSRPNMVRSLPQSGNENLILVARHFKLHSKVINRPQHTQFRFHFQCHLRWIHRSLPIILARSNMTTIMCIMTTIVMNTDTPLTLMDMTTKVTVTTCAGYSCMLWPYVMFRFAFQ